MRSSDKTFRGSYSAAQAASPSLLQFQWLVGVPLVLMPLIFAGARPWIWPVVASIFIIGLEVSLWTEPLRSFTGAMPKRWLAIWAFLLIYPILQVIPLPLDVIGLLSPQRAMWLHRTEDLLQLTIPSSSISYLPLATLFNDLQWLFFICYGMVLRIALRKSGYPNWLFHILIALVSIEAMYGLLQALIPSVGVLWKDLVYKGNATGTFINRNNYACFLGMIWPLLVAHILTMQGMSFQRASSSRYSEDVRRQEVGHKQLLLSFVVGMVLLALFFSKSRAGIVCAVLASSILVCFLRFQRRSVLMLILAACWSVMGIYGSIIGFGSILQRFDILDESAPSRLKLWHTTWQIVRDHIFTGAGLGAHGSVFLVYQTHLPDNRVAMNAHNDYLQLAAELGLPVAIAVIALVWGFWCKTAYHLWNKDNGISTEKRLIGVGALAGSAAFLCHCFVDFNWQIPADQLCFVMLLVLMGWSTSEANSQGASNTGESTASHEVVSRRRVSRHERREEPVD